MIPHRYEQYHGFRIQRTCEKRLLFSVVIASRDNGERLRWALSSVLDQTFDNWQCVVVDDCSSSDTDRDIIRCMQAGDPRFHSLFLGENLGYGGALDYGIRQADGDVVVILDGDDQLLPHALSVLSDYYLSHPDSRFVYSQHIRCSGAGGDMRSVPGDTMVGFCMPLIRELGGDALGQLGHGLVVSHCKSFRLELYDQVGGIDPELRWAIDADLVLKCEEATQLHFLDRPLYLYLTPAEDRDYTSPLSRIVDKANHRRRSVGYQPDFSSTLVEHVLLGRMLSSCYATLQPSDHILVVAPASVLSSCCAYVRRFYGNLVSGIALSDLEAFDSTEDFRADYVCSLVGLTRPVDDAHVDRISRLGRHVMWGDYDASRK